MPERPRGAPCPGASAGRGPSLRSSTSTTASLELGPRLQALTVTDAPELGDDALAALLDAPRLAGLRRLDLRGAGATAAPARALALRGPRTLAGDDPG